MCPWRVPSPCPSPSSIFRLPSKFQSSHGCQVSPLPPSLPYHYYRSVLDWLVPLVTQLLSYSASSAMSCNLLLVFLILLSLLKIKLKSPQMLSCTVCTQHPLTSVGLCSFISQSSLPSLSKGANYFTTVTSWNRISISRGAAPHPSPYTVTSLFLWGFWAAYDGVSHLSVKLAYGFQCCKHKWTKTKVHWFLYSNKLNKTRKCHYIKGLSLEKVCF